MTDILTPEQVDEIDIRAHHGEHTDGDLAALIASHRALVAQVESLESWLRFIKEARGPYNMDRLTHASNVIEAMQGQAQKALDGEEMDNYD